MNRFIFSALRSLLLLALVWFGLMMLMGSARTLFGQTLHRNPNPLHLDANGRASVILQQGKSYLMILYAPGTGHWCIGQAVGPEIWRQDNVRWPLRGKDKEQLEREVRETPPTLFNDGHGNPASAGILCTYKAGTTIPQYTLSR